MTVSVKLKATVVPRSVVRATILGDVMANFGLPPDVIELAQRGYASGDISGISICGIDHRGYIADQANLMFDQLTNNDGLSVDTSSGRSMIEAVSVKFAYAVEYSVNTMRRKGLSIQYRYHFYAGRNHEMGRYNLVPSNGSEYEPGHSLRQIFSVQPGMDPGITYSHATTWRMR